MRPRSASRPVGTWIVVLVGFLGAACGPAAPPAAAPPAATPLAAGAVPAAAPVAQAPISVRVSYASPAVSHATIWVAQDRGFFREYGLDVDLVFLSGTLTDQGVTTGETPIGHGTNLIPTRLAGADLVGVAGVVQRMTFTLFTRPEITSADQLRGKTILTSRPGAAASTATLLTLEHLGLQPHRDVQLQPTGGTVEKMALMLQGLGDASLYSLPDDLQAQQAGLVPLLNLSQLPIPFMQTVIGTTRAYARDNEEVVRRFLRGYVAAVASARADAQGTQAIMSKYMQLEDPFLLDYGYRYYRDIWARPDFRVQPEAVQANLRLLEDVPGAATARPEDFIDNRFIDELHASGFIREVGAE